MIDIYINEAVATGTALFWKNKDLVYAGPIDTKPKGLQYDSVTMSTQTSIPFQENGAEPVH